MLTTKEEGRAGGANIFAGLGRAVLKDLGTKPRSNGMTVSVVFLLNFVTVFNKNPFNYYYYYYFLLQWRNTLIYQCSKHFYSSGGFPSMQIEKNFQFSWTPFTI